jgi:hemoglobin-like flavoprotein
MPQQQFYDTFRKHVSYNSFKKEAVLTQNKKHKIVQEFYNSIEQDYTKLAAYINDKVHRQPTYQKYLITEVLAKEFPDQ